MMACNHQRRKKKTRTKEGGTSPDLLDGFYIRKDDLDATIVDKMAVNWVINHFRVECCPETVKNTQQIHTIA